MSLAAAALDLLHRHPGRPLLITEVERRILRACKTLRAIPDPEAKFQSVHNCWPDILQAVDDAYGYTEAIMPRFRPSPGDVSDMLIALDWAKSTSKRDFRLVWWRSFGISFKHIGFRIHRSDETARLWYKDTILGIWHEANSARKPVHSIGQFGPGHRSRNGRVDQAGARAGTLAG